MEIDDFVFQRPPEPFDDTLSIQRPLPSMETLMPASVKMPVNLGLVN
jgi:hypothetical protein